MTCAIFYASKSGHAKEVANKISFALDEIRVFDIAVTGSEYINDYKHLVFGISTWNHGQMQQDWQKIWKDFSHIDFKGKKVAIFGLGDQKKYPDEFADAMRYVYDDLISHGATVVGFTSTKGYEFNSSKAVIDGKFVGLVLDEDNQSHLTDERIKKWAEEIKSEILYATS
ncbi:flavodoxin [Malaciobacter mytili]|uniref:Flavodoxin n=1 Tax=Malaciobacter mytili LMG 24559 TaxID=1032238 RepID=A0AAX2AHQ2_9BACT|nr:flavodoxin [Malaciobacter mytili]AXH15709.1 flavodoxin [Malaciobacter mytili LMG 24559]RXI39660.1 flavodoxin [Malaciobacter mytili]RXK16105.1 flavodoxin [Malaciobacter mytili LMG 24559]